MSHPQTFIPYNELHEPVLQIQYEEGTLDVDKWETTLNSFWKAVEAGFDKTLVIATKHIRIELSGARKGIDLFIRVTSPILNGDFRAVCGGGTNHIGMLEDTSNCFGYSDKGDLLTHDSVVVPNLSLIKIFGQTNFAFDQFRSKGCTLSWAQVVNGRLANRSSAKSQLVGLDNKPLVSSTIGHQEPAFNIGVWSIAQ